MVRTSARIRAIDTKKKVEIDKDQLDSTSPSKLTKQKTSAKKQGEASTCGKYTDIPVRKCKRRSSANSYRRSSLGPINTLTKKNTKPKRQKSKDSPQENEILMETECSKNGPIEDRVEQNRIKSGITVSKKRLLESDDSDEEVNIALKANSYIKKKSNTNNKKNLKKTDDFCSSLEALLADDLREKEEKDERKEKLKNLREEVQKEDDTFAKFNYELEASVKQINDEGDYSNRHINTKYLNEVFGYVFSPMDKNLEPPKFTAVVTHSYDYLKELYDILRRNDDDLLADILWNKLILQTIIAEVKKGKGDHIYIPSDITRYLFLIMSCHPSTHIVRGAFNNLVFFLRRRQESNFASGLAHVAFNDYAFYSCDNEVTVHMIMEWKPTFHDFLEVFRMYGFRENRRTISSVQKIIGLSQKHNGTKGTSFAMFPCTNMIHVLSFLVLCLRSRMNFENELYQSIKELGGLCIEELLDSFEGSQWFNEWAPLICLRVAGTKEGIFATPKGWLSVVRQLPKFRRGRLLSCSIAVYVLQHRKFDGSKEDTDSPSPDPLCYPLDYRMIVDVTSEVTDTLISTLENVAQPDFETMYFKLALVDIALQSFLSKMQEVDMKLLLDKFDTLTDLRRDPMSTAWYQLKALVTMMRRTYLRRE